MRRLARWLGILAAVMLSSILVSPVAWGHGTSPPDPGSGPGAAWDEGDVKTVMPGDASLAPGFIYLPLVRRAAPIYTILNETFEGNFPGSWQVWDLYTDYGDYRWGKRSCRAFSGSYSGWAVGGGGSGAGLGCGSTYPNRVKSWMQYGPFSLTDATQARVDFKAWLNTETDWDDLFWGVSTDNYNFYGLHTSGNSNGWVDMSLDLSNVYTLGDVTGESQVWFAIVFETDSTVTQSEGVYVDNILLRKSAGVIPAMFDATGATGSLAESDDTTVDKPAMMILSRDP